MCVPDGHRCSLGREEKNGEFFKVAVVLIMVLAVVSFFFFNFIYLFIYLFILFLAVLGLRFCVRAFSSCGKRGPFFNHSARVSHCRGLSCCGAQAPEAQAQ